VWQADLRSYAQAIARFAFSSVRARLLILVLLVIIPCLGLIIYMAREERLQEIAQAGQSTLKLAREAATQQQRSISQTRDFLSELAQYPEMDHPKAQACPALLAKELNEHPEYVNVFVLTLDGELICSALPFEGRLNLSNRTYFQLAVTRKSFSVGDYQISRVTGKATLGFGQPVLDETGKFTAVLAAALDLSHLSDLIKNARLPEGSAMLLIDSKGTVLVHHPDPPAWRRAGPQRIVGKSMTDQPLVRKLLASKGEEIGQEVGLDGVHRLYAFAPIRVAGDARAYVGIGIPIEVAFADANRTLWRNLILLGLVSLLAFGAAWFGGDFFILRRVDDLVSATRRLAAGDLSARTALPYEHSELSQLARSFDGMAESLQKHQAEIEQAEKALHTRHRELQILYQTGQTVLTSPDLKTALEKILDEAVAVDSFDLGTILLVDPSGEKIEAAASRGYLDPANIERRPSEEATKWSRYRAGWYRNTTVVENVADAEGLRTLKREGIQSAVLTPVRAGEKTLGILQVGSRTRRQFDADKVRLLEAIGDQMSIAVQKARLHDETQQNLARIRALHEIDLAITSTLDLGSVLDVLLEKTERLLPHVAAATVRLLNKETGELAPVACRNLPEEEWKAATAQAASRGIAWLLPNDDNSPVAILNVQTETSAMAADFLRKYGLVSGLRVPLKAKNEVLGVVTFFTSEQHEFGSEEIEFLSTLAEQGAIAIQNAYLHEGTKRSLDQVHALHEIDVAITSTLDLHAILHVLLEKIDLVLPYAATTVRLFNPKNGLLEPVACRNLDEEEWKTEAWRGGRGLANVAFETNAPTVIGNAQTDPRVRDPEFYRKHKLISYLAIPLIAKEETLGIIGFYTKQEHDFSNEEVEFLKTLASQAAIAIYNSQLFEETGRSKKELESTNRYLEKSLRQLGGLYTALTPINAAVSMPELMSEIIGRLMGATNADAALIRVWNKEDGTLPIVSHRGFSDDYLKHVETAPPGGALDWVIKHSEPIITPDIASDLRLKGKVQLQMGLRSCAILPLNVHGEVRGILHVASCKLGCFKEEQKDHLTAIARQMSIALENHELFYSLKSSRDKLKKANRAKDEFLAMISHELRTPLNVIMGYTGLVREGMFGALSPQQDDALKKVASQSYDLLSIVSNLLRATQMGSGEIRVERARTDLGQLLDEIKSTYDLPATNELTLNWDFPSDLPTVETDSEKLRHILVNLIHNAIKFTEKGCITIGARHLPKSKTLRFTVADTGPGIPRESLPIIFDKFHQLDSSNTRTHGGLGLGLYIVKKYTELLGGEIEVKSELDRGSTFTVTIPYESARYTTWQDDRCEQTL